jgi:hypothetical protein
MGYCHKKQGIAGGGKIKRKKLIKSQNINN